MVIRWLVHPVIFKDLLLFCFSSRQIHCSAEKMDRRPPFGNNPTGINLLQLPIIGNALANPRQFLNNLCGVGPLQAQGQQNMNRDSFGQDNRGERMRFSDNYYDREQMASRDRGQRSLREPHDIRMLDRGDYGSEDRRRIHGLMDKEIPVDFLFPEMESSRHTERYGKDDFDRGSYHTSKTNSQSASFRSQPDGKGLKFSPSEIKYGRRDNTAIPWNAQLRPNCYLVPPLDDTHVLALSEQPPGCHTVFVSGLPGLTDEVIVKEIFNVCGPIESISFKNARKNSQVKYCQVTFHIHDSVEKAVKFNGHVLVIGDGSDRKTKISRIRVNYDEATKDIKKNVTNVVNTQKPAQKEEEQESTYYNRKKAFQLLDLLRHDASVVESLEVLAHWFEKGECNRSTVNVFHTILSTIHSFVKRLINKRKEHERQVEKQKKQAVDKANEIKQQCKLYQCDYLTDILISRQLFSWYFFYHHPIISLGWEGLCIVSSRLQVCNYPWFKFCFRLFLGMVICDNEFKTKKNKI